MANHLNPVRQMYMQSMVAKYSKEIGKRFVRFLEVGSYAGMSAVLWVTMIKRFFGDGELVCVDLWDTSRPKPKNPDATIETNKGLLSNACMECGIVQDLFNYNIEVVEAWNMVTAIRGDSRKVLPMLKDKSFDVIYIDGDHRYKFAKSDIVQAKRLVKDDGIICGDDFELAWELVDPLVAAFDEDEEYISEK